MLCKYVYSCLSDVGDVKVCTMHGGTRLAWWVGSILRGAEVSTGSVAIDV